MRFTRLLVALVLSVGGTAAALAQQAGAGPNPHKEAVTPESIERRIETRASEIEKMAPRGAARFVVYDLGWPLDVAEYRTLGKHGVLLVSALSQQADELPLKRVYTQADGKVTPLQRLFSTRRAVPAGSLARKVFGPYQEDSFYLVPAGALMQEWLLFCDFAKNRNEFSISRSPMTPPEFIQSDRERHVIAKPIPVALRAFLEREYPGFDHQKWMP